MKHFAVLAALLSVGLAEEAAKPAAAVTYSLPLAHGLPLTYGAAGLPLTYASGIPYTAPITYSVAAPVETKVEVAEPVKTVAYTAAAPAVTYTAAAPAVTYTAAAPSVTYAAAVAAAPVTAPLTYAAAYTPGSQFHAQDEFGNLNYGYSNINSVKQEVGNTYGGVSGGYSYVDAEGKLQTVNYVADAAGFRVADSRLPVAPTFNPEPLVAPVFNGVAPEPVADTPEVAEARAAHLAALEAANADRKKREADPAILASSTALLSAPTPLIHNAPLVSTYGLPVAGYTGYGYSSIYNYGLPYSAGLLL